MSAKKRAQKAKRQARRRKSRSFPTPREVLEENLFQERIRIGALNSGSQGDFLDEMIAERTVKNPDYPRLVAEATARRVRERTV